MIRRDAAGKFETAPVLLPGGRERKRKRDGRERNLSRGSITSSVKSGKRKEGAAGNGLDGDRKDWMERARTHARIIHADGDERNLPDDFTYRGRAKAAPPARGMA